MHEARVVSERRERLLPGILVIGDPRGVHRLERGLVRARSRTSSISFRRRSAQSCLSTVLLILRRRLVRGTRLQRLDRPFHEAGDERRRAGGHRGDEDLAALGLGQAALVPRAEPPFFPISRMWSVFRATAWPPSLPMRAMCSASRDTL